MMGLKVIRDYTEFLIVGVVWLIFGQIPIWFRRLVGRDDGDEVDY